LSVPAAQAGSGGPDDYGYLYYDSDSMHGPQYSWVDITATGTHHNALDDAVSELVSIGFYFEYYGQTYNTLYIQSNGGITFDNGVLSDYPDPFPLVGSPDDIVAPFWDDLMPVPWFFSPVYTETLGTAPNRTFVVQFDGIPHSSNPFFKLFFEIILEEGTNRILVQYEDVVINDAGSTNGGEACVGIQGNTEGYLQYSFNEAVLTNDLAVEYRLCQPSDGDGDGYTDCEDCDDSDADIHPYATEICDDGIDQNCDDVADELTDQDGDGESNCTGDCDDAEPLAYPGNTEVCDGIDNNCDGVVDEGFDGDGDGYTTCGADGIAGNADDDCDDADAAINPGAPEECDAIDHNCDGYDGQNYDADGDGFGPCDGDCDDDDVDTNPAVAEQCDGQDNNCDGVVPADETDDGDGDGWVECADCDDADAAIFPGAEEQHNAIDDDCDGMTDETFDEDADGYSPLMGDCDDHDPNFHPNAPELCDYADNDCDNELASYEFDNDGDGYLECEECDDTDPEIHPGATEICDDGIDSNCNGDLEEWEVDNDGDGFSECANDCNDEDDTIHPDAEEICDDIDNDCTPTTSEYADYDGDAFNMCQGDCDDDDPEVNPGEIETCDGKDNDCNGEIDEGFDADLDGYSGCGEDCDDDNASVNPGVEEVPYDNLDNDCVDGDLVDVDGDGHDGAEAGGDDCNDQDDQVHSGMDEVCDDGKDNDCDGIPDGDDPDCQEKTGCKCSTATSGSSHASWMLIAMGLVALARRRR